MLLACRQSPDGLSELPRPRRKGLDRTLAAASDAAAFQTGFALHQGEGTEGGDGMAELRVVSAAAAVAASLPEGL